LTVCPRELNIVYHHTTLHHHHLCVFNLCKAVTAGLDPYTALSWTGILL